MLGFIIIFILLGLFIYYDPYIDIQEDQIIFWYSNQENRKYKILWSKKT